MKLNGRYGRYGRHGRRRMRMIMGKPGLIRRVATKISDFSHTDLGDSVMCFGCVLVMAAGLFMMLLGGL